MHSSKDRLKPLIRLLWPAQSAFCALATLVFSEFLGHPEPSMHPLPQSFCICGTILSAHLPTLSSTPLSKLSPLSHQPIQSPQDRDSPCFVIL